MRHMILAISTFALGCSVSPAAEEETCAYYGNGSAGDANDMTVLHLFAPLDDGTIEIGCAKGTIEPVGVCLDLGSQACSEAKLSVVPALRVHSATMTISSGDRSAQITADWSFLTSPHDITNGIQELRLILMNDTRNNSCFVFPAATTIHDEGISASIGPALAFEPCGPFQ